MTIALSAIEGALDAHLQDQALCSVRSQGRHCRCRALIDADLGGGVIKQRIARPGQGKSGGFRSIVLFRRQALAFFVYGFAKNDRDNIDRQELRAFRLLAAEMLALNDKELQMAIKNGTITEIAENG